MNAVTICGAGGECCRRIARWKARFLKTFDLKAAEDVAQTASGWYPADTDHYPGTRRTPAFAWLRASVNGDSSSETLRRRKQRMQCMESEIESNVESNKFRYSLERSIIIKNRLSPSVICEISGHARVDQN